MACCAGAKKKAAAVPATVKRLSGSLGSMLGESDGSINSDFAKIGLASVDDLFGKAGEILQIAEDIRAGIFDCKQNIMDLTGQDYLKDPTLGKALKAWLISCAVQCGDVTKIKPSITTDGVELELPAEVDETNREVLETLKNFINTIKDAPTKVPEILTKVKELAEGAQALATKAPGEFKAAGFGAMEVAKALKTLAGNTKILVLGAKTLAETFGNPQTLIDLAKDVADLVAEVPALLAALPEEIKKALETMKDLFKDGKAAISAKDIAIKLLPGDKLTDKDISADKKKADKKAKFSKRKENKAKKAAAKAGKTDAAAGDAAPAAAAAGTADAAAAPERDLANLNDVDLKEKTAAEGDAAPAAEAMEL